MWLASCFTPRRQTLPVEGGAPATSAADSRATDWKEQLSPHYQLIKTLGVGGYSTVFLARRRADGQRYALKVTDLTRLTDWSRQAAVREAHVLAASSHHPCIPTFREAFCVGSRLCIASDMAQGGDLKQLLEERAAEGAGLAEHEVWSIMLQLALALQLLHANLVLHRDTKPSNVLLSVEGVVQLTDFGICGQLSSVFTRKQGAGSPQYKAPEMWLGQPYSFSSDMWSLGCLLYEMCAGQPLFDAPPGTSSPGAAVEAVRQQVLGLTSPPALPAGYSAELQQLADALLQLQPAARPTADELLAMRAVVDRMHTLPQAVQQQLQQLSGSEAGRTLVQVPEPVSFEPAVLNACLPLPAFQDGSRGVADALLGVVGPHRSRAVWPARSNSRRAGSRDASHRTDISLASSVHSCCSDSVASLDLAVPLVRLPSSASSIDCPSPASSEDWCAGRSPRSKRAGMGAAKLEARLYPAALQLTH